MIVVADTSPLNYLILVGYVDVLHHLYGDIVMPPAVEIELLHPSAPDAVRRWMKIPPAWLEVRTPSRMEASLHPRLDEGEREAISIAYADRTSTLIIDEFLGRHEAMRLGIQVIGTLGVLRKAHDSSLIVLADAIQRLRLTSFKAADALWDQFTWWRGYTFIPCPPFMTSPSPRSPASLPPSPNTRAKSCSS